MEHKSWSLLVMVVMFTFILVACSGGGGESSGNRYITNVTAISAGEGHVVALKNDGTV